MTGTELDFDQLRDAATSPRAAYGAGAHIVCDNLVKIYKVADLEVVALQGLDLVVDEGELVAIVGASGSGKSTLMNVLGGLDTPSAGRAQVGGYDLLAMNAASRTRYRRHMVGFVWQQTTRNLLSYLDARENIELPMMLAGVGRAARRARATELLALMGMSDRSDHRPDRMSGGEQQRVAIAVALANGAEVLLADEPTGELDTRTSEEIFRALRSVSEDLGVTVIVCTHDPGVSGQVDRTVAIRDGRTSTETFRRARGSDGEIIAEEYALLDRAGRLQLPSDYVSALELERRVRLALEEDHIGVWPDDRSSGTRSDRAADVVDEAEPPPAPTPTGDIPVTALRGRGRNRRG